MLNFFSFEPKATLFPEQSCMANLVSHAADNLIDTRLVPQVEKRLAAEKTAFRSLMLVSQQ